MSTSVNLLPEKVEQAITNSCTYLFSVQRPDGSWQDHVSSSAIATSFALYALYHADRQRFTTILHRGCAWLRATQHANGGWGDAVVDASTLNATALSVSALKLIEPDASSAAIARALAYIDSRGGFATVANPKVCSMSPACLTLLALANLYPWEQVTSIPFTFILLPRRIWRPFSFTLPNIFSWGLIHERKLAASPLRRWLNQLLKPRVLQWIESARGVNGSWEDSPLATGIVSLGLVLSGMPAEQVDPALSYLLATQRADGSWAAEEDLELSVTLYILSGLEDVGQLEHPRLKATREWLLASYHDEPFAPTDCPGGWWSWRLPSGWPDTDDTAGTITALSRLHVSTSHPYMQKGCNWLCKMQNRDGSWNMFVRESHALVDEPCPALTARALLALHNCRESPGHKRYTSAINHALAYLQQAQRSDGALQAFWFLGLVYGTAQVLETYAALNLVNEAVAHKCRSWLLQNQHADGSWGGDADNTAHTGTVEETAWALAALATPGVDAPDEALHRAATWLIQQQRNDGGWHPSVIGCYTRTFLYSSDHIANGFALRALGRYHHLQRL